jgi:hypothetical protein
MLRRLHYSSSGLLSIYTSPLSSKLLRIPYAAGVILVAPDDGCMRPKYVDLSLSYHCSGLLSIYTSYTTAAHASTLQQAT